MTGAGAGTTAEARGAVDDILCGGGGGVGQKTSKREQTTALTGQWGGVFSPWAGQKGLSIERLPPRTPL